MVNFCIVGLGRRGTTHLAHLRDIPGVHVSGICDVRKPTVSLGSISYFRSYRRMLQSVPCDAAVIAVPPYLHCEIGSYFLSHGKHVLIEKPLALTPLDATRMIGLAQKYGLVCMPAYHLRFDPRILKVKGLLESGSLGRILMVRGRQAHNWGGLRPLPWHVDAARSGGGTIIDNGSHYIDLFRFLFGEIATIHAFANNLRFGHAVEDGAVVNLEFTSGVIGSIELSWGDASGRNNQLVIWCSGSVVEVRESNLGDAVALITSRPDDGNWNSTLIVQPYVTKGIERIQSPNSKDRRSNGTDAVYDMLSSFLANIQSRGGHEAPLRDAAVTVKIIHAMYESIKRRRVVRIPHATNLQ